MPKIAIPQRFAVLQSVLFMLTVMPCALLAQVAADSVMSLPSCCQAKHNILRCPSQNAAFDSLLLELRQGEHPINILHIGGSHVQAGIFSHRLRQNFGASRGLLFPWSAIRSNAPADYTLTHTGKWERCRCLDATPAVSLGMSGAAAITGDSSASLRLELPEEYAFTRLRLLGEGKDGAEPIIIMSDNDTISAVRDSSDYLFHLASAINSCTIAFRGLTDSTRFVLRGLFPEGSSQRITYSESGVNGASVPSWLRCSLLAEELGRTCPPDLVIFGIGINDANVPMAMFDVEAFKNNYRLLMDEFRTVNPNVHFLFITNNDCWLRVGRGRRIPNRNTQKVEQAMMELAEECNGAVWNQFRVMGGFSSSNRWVNARLMNRDHIHFLRSGYELMADLMFRAIQTAVTI